MPEVSVIIPCYNLGQYLDEAVDSVLSQSFQDYEIIIVNDGSTDDYTNRLLAEYNKPKTTILWTPNQGLPSARNTGIEAAKGTLICCLDADDKYHPEFLSKTVSVMKSDRNKEIGFVTTWLKVFGDEDYVWHTQGYNPIRLAIENIVHVSSLFRKECWEQVGGYALNLRDGYEDWNFWIAITALGYQWLCLDEILFYYRKRGQSMLSSSNRKRDQLFSTIIDNNISFYNKNFNRILSEASAEFHKAWEYWKETNDRLIATENKLREREEHLREREEHLRETDKKLRETEKTLDIMRSQQNEILNSLTFQTMLAIGKVINRFFPQGSHQRNIAGFAWKTIRNYRTILNRSRAKHVKNTPWSKDAPLVSVVIPCYNYGKYIREALGSVLSQTFQNFEIIVVDGGSTDGETLNILRSLPKAKTTVHYRSGRHLVGSNRNFGIEKARGKYVCCLDADDMLRPTYLQKALFYLERYNYDVVYPSAQCFGESRLLWIVNNTTFLDNIETGNEVSTVAVFKKSAWAKAGGYKDWPIGEGHTPEDWEFWTRLLGYGFRFKRLKEPLMMYRVHDAGLTARCATTLEDQRAIIRKENAHLINKKNLRLISKRAAAQYEVKYPYINLREERLPDRTNILFCLPFVIVGGADRVLLTIAEHLSKNNYNVHVMTTQKTNPAFGDNTAEYERITREIYHLDSFMENEDEWKDFILYLIEVKNIDILFLVGSEFTYNMIPVVKKKHPYIKIVDQLFNEFGHLKNNRKHAESIDLTIAANETIREILVNQYHEVPEKVEVIVHGVDTESEFNPEKMAFSPRELEPQVPADKFVVSFIGRFSPEKSPDFFVDMAHALPQNLNLFFVMIGNGPEYAKVKNHIKGLGLEDKFYAPGIVDDVKPFLKRTNLLVIPSQIEGIPIILLEALSMGIPVIASAVGGIPSVIQHRQNGFLCDKNDLGSFVETVQLVYDDSNLRSEIGGKARYYAVNNISVDRMNKAYLSAFNNVLKGRQE